jgi:hypothetical protein
MANFQELDKQCEAAEALDKWPYAKPCKNERDGDSKFCTEHKFLEKSNDMDYSGGDQ